MPWSFFIQNDVEKLKIFLKSREYCCINFASAFRKKQMEGTIRNRFFTSHDDIIIHKKKGNEAVDSAIMLTKSGQLFPVSGDMSGNNNLPDISEGVLQLRNSLVKVNTIMGDKNSVGKILKSSFSTKKAQEGKNSFSYYVMTLENDQFKRINIPISGVKIRIASIDDLYGLIPLQENYEIEEVLPSPEMFNSYVTAHHLASVLKEQITVAAEKSGKIIAKANTNGRGFCYYQIGGVYTLPEYRGMGISTSVVRFLIEKIAESGMKPSLFVKTGNKAAIRVYTNLGFKIAEEFQITYFF
ncbi:MAG: GNAT family N-acetyltransferase [Spirochaetia bacterium]|jgi:predicted GNAT family acetyltransferase|nr:GNAT family N-acetyltransferase [Spirochaetia bacterium]